MVSSPQRKPQTALCRPKTGPSTWRSVTSSTRRRKGEAGAQAGWATVTPRLLPELPHPRPATSAHIGRPPHPACGPQCQKGPQRLSEPHPRQECGILNIVEPRSCPALSSSVREAQRCQACSWPRGAAGPHSLSAAAQPTRASRTASGQHRRKTRRADDS